MSFTDCFQGCLDGILGIRDSIGANIQPTSIVCRKWSGDRVGDGHFEQTETRMRPSPQIIDYSHNLRVQSGGTYAQGDLILKGISKNAYSREDLRTDTGDYTLEKFIKVGDYYYRTVNIKENLVTWEIQITKVARDNMERGI